MRARRAWVTVLCLGLAGCPKRPLNFGPRGEITDPAEIVSALAARSVKLLALEAEVSVSGESERGSGSTNGLLAAARPASLKLELDDFFGNPALILTTDGHQLGLYQAQGNLFAVGEASPSHLSQIVPLELPLAEAVALVFGDPQPLGGPVRSFTLDRTREAYALTFEAGEGPGRRTQQLEVDVESLLPVRVRVEGASAYEARFADFQLTSGLSMPRRVEVDSPRGKVTVKLRKPELNRALPQDLFLPAPPRGAKLGSFPG